MKQFLTSPYVLHFYIFHSISFPQICHDCLNCFPWPTNRTWFKVCKPLTCIVIYSLMNIFWSPFVFMSYALSELIANFDSWSAYEKLCYLHNYNYLLYCVDISLTIVVWHLFAVFFVFKVLTTMKLGKG